MSDFDIKFGPWLNYGTKDFKEKMIELTTEPWSPFNGCDNAQVFIYCMAHAFARGKRPSPPPSSGSGSMPASAFKRDMRDFMKALALEHHGGNLDVVADPKEVVRVGEGYGYVGFPEIYDRIKNKRSGITPEQILEEILQEIVDIHAKSVDKQPE